MILAGGMEGIQMLPRVPSEAFKKVTLRVRAVTLRSDFILMVEAGCGQPELGLRGRIKLRFRESIAGRPTSAWEGGKTHQRELTKNVR